MVGPLAIPFGRRRDRANDATVDLGARIDGRLDHAYRLATVILGNAMEAEDAVADAALTAWRARTSLRDTDRFDAWFDRILLNGCRDRLRVRRRRRVTSIDVAELAERADSGDFRQAVDGRDAVARAFRTLEPDEQMVVALRFWADLSIDAIADRIGVPAGTVKSRLNRALGRLRTALTVAEDDR